MKTTWQIAEWEILRNLKNKQFLMGLLITPLVVLFFASIPNLLERLERPKTEVYYFIDRYGAEELFLEETVEAEIEFVVYRGLESDLPEVVQEESAAGYFVIEENKISQGLLPVYLQGSNRKGLATIERLFSELVREKKLVESGLDREQLEYLMTEGVVMGVVLDDDLLVSWEQMIMSIAFAVVFFILIMGSSMMLLTSAIQEKKDRMVEIVLSSISPLNLMQGKIIGHFILGLVQLGFWLALGLPVARFVMDIPVFDYFSFNHVIVLFFYLLLGYILHAAIFVAIGSTMEDVQNASNAQGMIMMLPFLPLVLAAPVVSNPDGIVSTVASIFPLTSPVIMIFRTGFTVVPWWQIGVSLVILLITAFLFTALAAKIFRVGMLMYGKNVSLVEMWRWMRHKD